MRDYTITFFSTLRQEDDGLVHVRVQVELPVHPSYLTDAASGQTLAKDVGLDVTAKLMEKFEQLAAGPEADSPGLCDLRGVFLRGDHRSQRLPAPRGDGAGSTGSCRHA